MFSRLIRNIDKRVMLVMWVAVTITGSALYLSQDRLYSKMYNEKQSEIIQLSQDITVNGINIYFEDKMKYISMMANSVDIPNYFNLVDEIGEEDAHIWVEDGLLSFINYETAFLDVYVGYKNGEVIAASGWQAPEDYDPRTRDWYELAVGSNEPIITDPYVDEDTGETVVTIAEKMIDPVKGDIAGVIAIDMELDTFKSIFLREDTRNGTKSAISINGEVLFVDEPELAKKFTMLLDQKETRVVTNGSVYNVKPTALENIQVLSRTDLTRDAVALRYSRIERLLIVLAMLLLIMSILQLLFKNINKSISNLEVYLDDVNKGHISKKLDIKDKSNIGDLARSLNNSILTLSSMIKATQENFQGIKDLTSEILTKSENISEKQNSIENSMGSIANASSEQLNELNGISDLAIKIHDRMEATINSYKDMEDSVKVLLIENKKVIDISQSIHEGSEDSIEKLEVFSEGFTDVKSSLEEIVTLTSQVQAISSQTNLLALNAAIESARAGEAGKGFAVVADEIRKLAVNVDNTAKEIGDISKTISVKTEDLTDKSISLNQTIKHQMDIVKQQMEIVNIVNQDTEAISSNIATLSKRMGDVKDDTTSISSSIQTLLAQNEELTSSTEDVRNSVEETTRDVEDIIQDIGEMVVSVDNLTEDMDKFK